MENIVESNFCIKRFTSSKDKDFVKALMLYNDTIPVDTKTSSNEISKIYWEFDGDLMSRFSIGDSVSFKTEVISIDSDLNLETLDILGYQAEVAPNIDSHLLSHLQKN